MESETGGQQSQILLVEDDAAVAMTLTDVLESEGYRVAHAPNGGVAKTLVDEVHPDLIILDLMLPDSDGLVLCSDLKSRADVPIIICSATNRKRDAVLGFKLGADDFVPKPFHVDELLTRVQAALRRAASRPKDAPPPAGASAGAAPVYDTTPTGNAQPRSYRVGDLHVDHARRSVKLGDVSVELTPTEYRLIAALASRPEEVLSRQDLAQIVWGYQDASIGRSIDVHLHRLRTKLKEANPRIKPPSIVAVRGFGYKITTQAEEETSAA
ncbi:MAG TPA: response regulator transcription factor [Chloroflexota bacterium]|nr:response regulator transcription factor [Chloroflexota bacterium]